MPILTFNYQEKLNRPGRHKFNRANDCKNPALQFGYSLASIGALFSSSVTVSQVCAIIDNLFDLFKDHPKNPEIGRRNKVINGINMIFSTVKSIIRIMPIAMISYFAISTIMPTVVLWPLLITNCVMVMFVYANFFFEQYQKLPAYLNTEMKQHDFLQKELNKIISIVTALNNPHVDALSDTLEVQVNESQIIEVQPTTWGGKFKKKIKIMERNFFTNVIDHYRYISSFIFHSLCYKRGINFLRGISVFASFNILK